MRDYFRSLALALLVVPAQAQLFGPDSLTGAALGGIVGAVIGHNSGRHGGEGAAIGAGIGAVLGAVVGEERRHSGDMIQEPAYVPVQSRPNYAVGGAVLGGVAGAVIGHNQGRRGAEGVAIGAASGLVIGSIMEQSARRREWVASSRSTLLYQPVMAASPGIVSLPTEAPTLPPAPVITSSSPSSSANALFGR